MKTLTILLAACLMFCGQTVKQPEIKSVVTFVKGKVFSIQEGKNARLVVNTSLNSGDTVITKNNSTAEILIKDFGILKIGSNSNVMVRTLVNGVRANLSKGDMVAVINKKRKGNDFAITTPTAIAGVRGTVVMASVKYRGNNKAPVVKFAVGSGKVIVVGNGGEAILTKNTQLTIHGVIRLSQRMVQPLSKHSLIRMKHLIVFHKTNILEYNRLTDPIVNSVDMNKAMGQKSLERRFDDYRKRSMFKDDAVAMAKRSDASKHLKRDVDKDRLKLKVNDTYKQ